MTLRLLVLPVLMALAPGVQAREPSESRTGGNSGQAPRADVRSQARPLPDAQALPAADAELLLDPRERQRRREVLREALRVQTEAAPPTARQLSVQEKAALRQQLREQKEWTK